MAILGTSGFSTEWDPSKDRRDLLTGKYQMRGAAILTGLASVCGLVGVAQACALGPPIDITVQCEPASVRLGWVVRHCTAALPVGFAVVSTNPSEGVSNLFQPPIMSIVSDVGPFAVSRAAFQQWASAKVKGAAGIDQANLFALANAPIWGRQVGRAYFQLVQNDPKNCRGQNCQAIMNAGWYWPNVRAICGAVGDFKMVP